MCMFARIRRKLEERRDHRKRRRLNRDFMARGRILATRMNAEIRAEIAACNANGQ